MSVLKKVDQAERQSGEKNSPNCSQPPRYHRIKKTPKEKFFHQRPKAHGKRGSKIGVGRIGEELIEGCLLRHRQKSCQKVEPQHDDAETDQTHSGDPRPVPANSLPETR